MYLFFPIAESARAWVCRKNRWKSTSSGNADKVGRRWRQVLCGEKRRQPWAGHGLSRGRAGKWKMMVKKQTKKTVTINKDSTAGQVYIQVYIPIPQKRQLNVNGRYLSSNDFETGHTCRAMNGNNGIMLVPAFINRDFAARCTSFQKRQQTGIGVHLLTILYQETRKRQSNINSIPL